jgi:hypothetical protein
LFSPLRRVLTPKNQEAPLLDEAAQKTQDRMRFALGENNCAACMIEFKLADRSQTPTWDAGNGLICTQAATVAPAPPAAAAAPSPAPPAVPVEP